MKAVSINQGPFQCKSSASIVSMPRMQSAVGKVVMLRITLTSEQGAKINAYYPNGSYPKMFPLNPRYTRSDESLKCSHFLKKTYVTSYKISHVKSDRYTFNFFCAFKRKHDSTDEDFKIAGFSILLALTKPSHWKTSQTSKVSNDCCSEPPPPQKVNT